MAAASASAKSEAAPSPELVETPPWLQERYPEHKWTSLCKCLLRVDDEQGAGLDMEVSELGYQVDAVEDQPGQDPALKPGSVIVAINGTSLLGLRESEQEDIFRRHFAQGAEVVFVSNAQELREAERKREENQSGAENDDDPLKSANWELLWRPKTDYDAEDARILIPVQRGALWELPPDVLADFERSLAEIGSEHDVKIEPYFHSEGVVESVELNGRPSKIAAARPGVAELLHTFRQRQAGGADGEVVNQLFDEAGGNDAVANLVEISSRKRMKGFTREENEPTQRAAEVTEISLPAHVTDVRQFQFHDHTADIIVHSWGKTRAEAFEQAVVGMFGYMTNIEQVNVVQTVEIEASGHDWLDLLFHLLDEFLFNFGSEFHISRCVEIYEFDEENFRIKARGYGERMDLKKHEQGTEVKAITMHQMKILGPGGVITEQGTFDKVPMGLGEKVREGFPYETYVLHDI